MSQLLLGVFAALVAFALAQQHCTPPQWEGVEINYDLSTNFRAHFNFSYDQVKPRVRIYAVEEVNGARHRLETIILFAHQQIYHINHDTGVCFYQTFNPPFQPDCLTGNVTWQAAAIDGGSLPVTIYETVNRQFQDTIVSNVALTNPDNVPVQRDSYDQRSRLDHSLYWDVTLGIKNDNVFNPPANCTPNSTRVDHPLAAASAQRYGGMLSRF